MSLGGTGAAGQPNCVPPVSGGSWRSARVANLARIALTEEELERLAPELDNIIGWVEQLGEVDTADVEPTTAVIPNRLRLREDVVTDGDCRDDVLANAPQAEHGFFAVPKVIE